MGRKKDASTELRRGALELGLLLFLDREPCFGGGIIPGLADSTNGGLTLTEGALYPALHRLEKNGLLASEWRDGVDGGRRRKYYLLTDDGRARLAELREAWTTLADGLAALMEDDGA